MYTGPDGESKKDVEVLSQEDATESTMDDSECTTMTSDTSQMCRAK